MSADQGTVFCHACGHPSSAGDAFCMNCGTELLAEAPAAAAPTRPAKRRSVLPVVLGMLILGGGAALAGAALFARPQSPGVATSSPAIATPRATATLRPVTYRADQLIVPPEQFPFTGYRVGEDRLDPSDPDGWLRQFVPPAGSNYRWIYVALRVAPPGRTYARAETCTGSADVPITSSTRIGAPSMGEFAAACRHAYATGLRVLTYKVVSRNFMIFTQVGVLSGDETVALGDVVTVAQRQLAIIDRLSPP